MINQILKFLSFIIGLIALFFFGKKIGEKTENQKQQELENENMQQNININKEVSNMSVDDKFNFLLSKQNNKNNK